MELLTAQKIIDQYQLKPHIEGGYYKESYRATGTIPLEALDDRFNGNRNYSTAIYFLLEKNDISLFHRLHVDEIWHFYSGDPLTLAIIYKDGFFEEITLGQDIVNGQRVQFVVPNECWMAAYLKGESQFSFVGCTTAPGFDFNDFELGERSKLIKQFPHAKEIIKKLTRED